MQKLRERMAGKWASVFQALGMDEKFLTGRNGPCPVCGGKDRFRINLTQTNGNYFCSCGNGDGFMLLEKWKGWDFKTAAKEIEKIIETVKSVTPVRQSPERNWSAVKKVWGEARELVDGDQVCQYLRGRGLTLPVIPHSLRWHPKLAYHDDSAILVPATYPAMLGIVLNASGVAVSVHRTYLDRTRKAAVSKPKKVMPGRETISGCAIRLAPAFDVLGVAEGVETALAAQEKFGLSVWSCLSSGGMESFIPPATVKHVIVFADNDVTFAGQKSAYALAYRLKLSGLIVDVEVPPKTGDWLDSL